MVRLTKRTIEAATYQGNGGRYVLWDDEIKGFGLRIYPSKETGKGQAKTFVLSYRYGGRKRLIALGRFGEELTLQQARDAAREARHAIRTGRDPLEERLEEADAATLKQLGERYLTDHAEIRKKPDSVSADRQMLRDYVLPKLRGKLVADINRQNVTAVHHALRHKPYVANRVLALMSKMLNLAEKWGLRPDGCNPCRHIEKYKEHKRERYLSANELGRLADTLSEAEQEGVHAIAAIRLLMFTGCRLREILRLRWQDVDLQNGRLYLPDSKTGSKVVYLAAGAREVLESVPRTMGHPFVCEGRLPDAHLTDLKGPWRRVCSRAGLDDVRIHDLRHSFGALGAGLGLSLPMIGKLLGHTQPATTARYAHLAADPMHAAAEKIGDELTAAFRGRAPTRSMSH